MAETINSFDTAQGRFDTVKYDAPVHIYSVDEAGKKVDIGEDKMLEAFPYKGPQEPPPAEPILEVASSEPTRIEVRAEDEPAVATETVLEDQPASAETNTGKENYRREAIEPERILELKDKFDQAYSKELELHNIKTDEDKKKDPWMVESSAEHVRSKILREYLKIGERDWDQQELAEVRNDIIHMMSLSTKSLESLMLKPEENLGNTATTPRTAIEAGPTVITPEPIVLEPEQTEEADAGPPPSVEPGEEPKSRMRRLGNWFRRPVHSTFLWINTRGVGRDKEGKPMIPAAVFTEEEPTNEKERKRRCLLPVLGALAVGVGAGYLLSKYGIPFIGGEDGSKDAITGVIPPDGSGAGSGGGHIEVFNHIDGDRSVQSILPDNLAQELTPGGFEHIIDKNTGQEVIDHVTYGENGRYSVDTIHELKDHGYDVGTKKIEIFDTTGPGPRGDITHKVSEVTS